MATSSQRSTDHRTETLPVGQLLVERGARIAEFKRRKKSFQQKKILPNLLESHLSEGWTQKRQLKSGLIVIEKQRLHEEVFENRVWCILYHLNAVDLNHGRNFKIEVVSDGESVKKQVDVFGRIDDIILVIECKSSAKKQRRSLQEPIGELSSLKRPIANSLRQYYGERLKSKIVWIIATNNIVVSEPDRLRAKSQNIVLLGDRDIRYFEEIAKNVGPAARYQFLAEFLADQQITSLSDYKVPATKIKLGGKTAFLFVAPPSRLLPVAFVNHRGLRDPDGAPSYQRVLKRSRLKEIAKYLDGGGFFPNCIIVNFQKAPRFDKMQSMEERQIAFGELYLPDRFKSIWVIDGQHRLYGFTEAEDVSLHSLPVLAFDRLEKPREAELFTTLNSKQQRVARGLLDELVGELRWKSEDFSEQNAGIAARVLDLMAAKTGGPFDDRIKTGDLSVSEAASLTLSQIKNGIISARLLGTKNKGLIAPGAFTRSCAEDTLHALYEGLTAYFELIEEANQERWESGREGYLCSNTGIQGHLRLIQALAEYLKLETAQEAHLLDAEGFIDQISPYLQPVVDFIANASGEEFERKFKQRFGSGGPPRYFGQLCLLVKRQFPSFEPSGFQQFVEQNDTEVQERGNWLVGELVKRVQTHVIEKLKVSYGAKDYWDKGIPNAEIKVSAYKKKVDDRDNDLPIETYLDVIELKKIVEAPSNWELFRETVSIQMQDDKKGQQKYLKWIEKLNEVRRIAAHPMGRVYKDSDIDFLEFIDEELDERGV